MSQNRRNCMGSRSMILVAVTEQANRMETEMPSTLGQRTLLQRIRRRLPARLLLIPVLVLAGLSLAVPGARSDDGFAKWLAEFWVDAQAFGISRATFDTAFRGVEPDLS